MALFTIQYLSKLFVCIFFAILLSFQCVWTNYASYCLTPEYKGGICLPVKSCASSYSLIKNILNLDADAYNRTVNLLRKSRCDRGSAKPHICCPRNETQMDPDIYAHLSQLNCGNIGKHRISHGVRASLYDFRWSALLLYEGSKKFRCGGSLITERYVLTAAHCCVNILEGPKAVRLGEYDLSTDRDCITTFRRTRCAEPYEDIDIETIIKHAGYKYRGVHYDIALLRLVRAVEFKKNILPLCLPLTKELQMHQNERYLVAGWGHTENNLSSNVLLYTSIPHQPRELCRQHLLYPSIEELNDGHICAGGDRLYDSCKGDSGGPIFTTNFYIDGSARSIQYGIVSLGVSSCGEITAPAVYTNISFHMQWITDHISLN